MLNRLPELITEGEEEERNREEGKGGNLASDGRERRFKSGGGELGCVFVKLSESLIAQI